MNCRVFKQVTLLLIPSLCLAEHFDIKLTAMSDSGAKQEAFADQSPPAGGLNPRPILKVRAGDKITFQFIMTNVYTHATFRGAGIHYYVVHEREIGQKALPALEGAVAEGSFNFDLKPSARVGCKEKVAISQPGIYLMRVESLRTQRDHEHFAAIDIEVR